MFRELNWKRFQLIKSKEIIKQTMVSDNCLNEHGNVHWELIQRILLCLRSWFQRCRYRVKESAYNCKLKRNGPPLVFRRSNTYRAQAVCITCCPESFEEWPSFSNCKVKGMWGRTYDGQVFAATYLSSKIRFAETSNSNYLFSRVTGTAPTRFACMKSPQQLSVQYMLWGKKTVQWNN